MAFVVLARQPTTEGTDEELLWNDILLSTECLARLVLGEQDQCQRNNSQIIAKFYEIGQIDLALELADDFKVTIFEFLTINQIQSGLYYAHPSLTFDSGRRKASRIFAVA
jgi:hypothetical protein